MYEVTERNKKGIGILLLIWQNADAFLLNEKMHKRIDFMSLKRYNTENQNFKSLKRRKQYE